MKTVGMVTTVIGIAALAGGVVIGVRAIPDIKRYLKIRQM